MTKATPIKNVDDLASQYPQGFDKIGSMPGSIKLVIDKNVQPHADLPRKAPIALKDTIKIEFDSMETNGINADIDNIIKKCSICQENLTARPTTQNP